MITQKNRFVGPLLLVGCGDKLREYTAKTKLSGVLVDNRLLWREHIDRAQKALGKQLRVLRKISYLKSHLLKEIYFKTVIP